MKNAENLDRKLDVWTDNYKTETVYSMGSYSPSTILLSQSLQWHYSFGIGFFGFHYIRAVKEHDPAFEQESLQTLKNLISAFDLDSNLLGNLDGCKRWGFTDFWDNVLRKISLEIGDSLGPEAQQMVKLGFWLAAVYAGLVEESSSDDDDRIKRYLEYLEGHLSELNASSQEAGIPESLIKPLTDSIEFLQFPKTPATARKCLQTLKLGFYDLLCTEKSQDEIQKI